MDNVQNFDEDLHRWYPPVKLYQYWDIWRKDSMWTSQKFQPYGLSLYPRKILKRLQSPWKTIEDRHFKTNWFLQSMPVVKNMRSPSEKIVGDWIWRYGRSSLYIHELCKRLQYNYKQCLPENSTSWRNCLETILIFWSGWRHQSLDCFQWFEKKWECWLCDRLPGSAYSFAEFNSTDVLSLISKETMKGIWACLTGLYIRNRKFHI